MKETEANPGRFRARAGMVVAGRSFNGPYAVTSFLENSAGVYLVVCQDNGRWRIVDCGQAERVRDHLESHRLADVWQRDSASFAVWYTVGPREEERMQLVREIVAKYHVEVR